MFPPHCNRLKIHYQVLAIFDKQVAWRQYQTYEWNEVLTRIINHQLVIAINGMWILSSYQRADDDICKQVNLNLPMST